MAASPDESVLLEAQQLVFSDRRTDYAEFAVEYAKVAQAFNAITGHRIRTADAVLFMVLLKMSRQFTGRPKRDNLVDAAGYIEGLNQVFVDMYTYKEA